MAATVLVAWAWGAADRNTTESAPAGAVAPVPAAVQPPDTAGTTGTTGPAVPPTHLWIPRIGVTTDLVGLGLNDDDTVEVPSVPAQAGWYELGPAPGQDGSAVILGHVDSREGPAVFFRLDELVAGDRLRIRLADGAVERFEVVGVATYANEDFPAQRVYAGTPRRATLTLVTCGGDYDAARGGYQSNVVVFTERVPARA